MGFFYSPPCFLWLLNQYLCSTHHVLSSLSTHPTSAFKFTTRTTFADFHKFTKIQQNLKTQYTIVGWKNIYKKNMFAETCKIYYWLHVYHMKCDVNPAFVGSIQIHLCEKLLVCVTSGNHAFIIIIIVVACFLGQM